jgi:hypothetical protein
MKRRDWPRIWEDLDLISQYAAIPSRNIVSVCGAGCSNFRSTPARACQSKVSLFPLLLGAIQRAYLQFGSLTMRSNFRRLFHYRAGGFKSQSCNLPV